MVGVLLERLFAHDLIALSERHGYYCDRRGLRPKVRGRAKKVTWTDADGNAHDLDFVIERDGSVDHRGLPVAFIETAWRRYTRHSRAKTGEIEGALLHLRQTYPTCRFLGVILAGAYSLGGKTQLTSHEIAVLHIPFEALATAFRQRGVDLSYPEKASAEEKQAVIAQWEQLRPEDLANIEARIRTEIASEYAAFQSLLEQRLQRSVRLIRIVPTFGREFTFPSVQAAIVSLDDFREERQTDLRFIRFDVKVEFSDDDEIEGKFHTKEEALRFISLFA